MLLKDRYLTPKSMKQLYKKLQNVKAVKDINSMCSFPRVRIPKYVNINSFSCVPVF